MIPFIIAAIPIEVEPYHQVEDWTEINRAAQLDTKQRFPWWWNKYVCEVTQWYPHDEQCIDLTE